MIDRLILNRFRGARTGYELDIPPGARLLVVYGPNGSGKSTLTDAIDYCLNGSAGSLADRSGASVRDLPSLGASSKEMSVEVHSRGAVCSSNNESPRPRAFVLRRKQVLSLGEATPSERFEQIRRFIDIGGVQKSEDALKKALLASQTSRLSAEEIRNSAAERLERLRAEIGDTSHGDTVQWAESKLGRDSGDSEALLQELDTLVTLADSAAAILSTGKETRGRADTLKQEAQLLLDGIASRFGAEVSEETGIAALLAEAESYVERADSLDECPVCGNPVRMDELRMRIRQTLEPLRALQEMSREAAAKGEAERAAREQLQNCRDQYARSVSALRECILGASPSFRQLLMDAGCVINPELDDSSFTRLIPHASEHFRRLRKQVQEQIGAHSAISVHLKQIEDADYVIARAQACGERLSRAHRIMTEARHSYVQETLDDVSHECDGLFRLLHPNEAITLRAMILDPGRKASLKQSAFFDGELECSPQTVFSDSHLDTMALCFWLALVLREAQEDSVMILDDALTSVDSDHAIRLAKLLYQLRLRFGMIIVTTHDESWRTALADLGNDVHVLNLGVWSSERGICAAS